MVIGFILGLCMSLLVGSSFCIGFHYGRNFGVKKKKVEKEDQENLDIEQAEFKKRQNAFKNMMDYDLDVATGRREQI